MEVTQVLFRIALGFLLFVESCGQNCHVDHVNPCYESLLHYEGLGFPFYGENESELEETCSMMNDSFECVEVFVDVCKGKSSCDMECQELIAEIDTFSKITGLREVHRDLCDSSSAIRQAYLENYSCLESNSHYYATCHNDSQMSQEHMATILDPVETVAAKCCFLTWYHDCFTNITRESCNENATLFVSLTLYKLMNHVSEKLCGPNPDVCDRPPLPPTDPDEEESSTTEMGNDIDVTVKDKDHSVTYEDDSDNTIDDDDGKGKSESISHTCSIWTFVTALSWMVLSKYML